MNTTTEMRVDVRSPDLGETQLSKAEIEFGVSAGLIRVISILTTITQHHWTNEHAQSN